MARKAKHILEAERNGTRLTDLVPDPQLRERMLRHLIDGKDVLAEGSPFAALLQQSVNDILSAEMDAFQAERAAGGEGARPSKRNGYTPKTVRSSVGDLAIHTPRDRAGEFEPQLIGKRVERLGSGMDAQILALYAQGNSVEDVRRLLAKLYSVEMSAGAISRITDQLVPQLNAWCSRPLASCYAIVYLDAMVFKVRSDGRYAQSASYTCYGIDAHGQRDILGLYFTDAEGAAAWGRILEDIRSRGVEEVLVFCVDGLAGFTEVIGEVYPAALVQRCVVHAVRAATRFVDERDRKALHAALRAVYTAPTRAAAESRWEEFEAAWAGKYPGLIRSWEAAWPELTVMFDFGAELRRMIYTTNPVEAVHRIVRKLIKGKAAWVSQQALAKQLYASLQQNERSWRRGAYGWKAAQRELAQVFGERFTKYLED